MTAELFASRTGIKIIHVPYRGAAPAANDLAGGHVDMMFCDLGTILPLAQAGRVRIIGTATLDRLAQIPDVPTIDAGGVKGFSSTTFYALMAPPKTPRRFATNSTRRSWTPWRHRPRRPSSKPSLWKAARSRTAEMGEYIKDQAKLWSDVIRSANITVEQ